jgi:hypothetical protein
VISFSCRQHSKERIEKLTTIVPHRNGISVVENLGEKEKAYARGHLSQPRTVELAHFLVAERSMDMTVMIETDQRVEPPPEIRVAHPHLGERATQRREGTLPVREAREKLMKQGLDLSSEDQWEVAAALGKPYLFRWKKIPNFDFYPSSTRSNMINRRAWVKRLQAGGILDDDSAKFLIGNEIWSPFRRHLAANELGLKLGSPFNRGELCREGFLKGGDGGEAECGGYDSFYAWLPLSPFFRESSNSWEAGDVRPVIDSKRN